MKITKEKFIDILVNRRSIFCGATHDLLSKDEIYCLISGWFHEQFITSGVKPLRTCKRYPDGLMFLGNGNVISLPAQSTYNQYEYQEGVVLTVTFPKGNTFYYIVRNADQTAAG